MQRAIIFFRTVGLIQHANHLIKLRGITTTSTSTSNLSLGFSLLTSERQQFKVLSQSPRFSTTTDSRSIKRMGDAQSTATDLPESNSVERPNKVRLSEEQWKSRLTDEQFYVCRKKGTERAWTGDLLENKGPGTYQCAACGADLFTSTTKFDSGSGWPSFYDVVRNQDNVSAVEVHVDRSHGMTRTEVLCGQCDSHLGHVFNDGPKPTGLRYCINSVSLKFKPAPSKP